MRTKVVTSTEDIFSDFRDDETVVIGHGVNVKGVMGAGFAALIARRFPDVKSTYQQACINGALPVGSTQIVPVDATLSVANIASQEHPGPDATVERLLSGLRDLYRQTEAVSVPVNVRLPLIGAGIGGIDPITAAHAILLTACDAPDHVRTSLHLLTSDEHTASVVAYHRGWFLETA